MRVLITGGAGFIGSHLTDELLIEGYDVRVLDCLEPQVHGDVPAWPAYLSTKAERMLGSVTDPAQINRAMRNVDAVFHLAATVGVGQSMYRIAEYVRQNALGTAVLLEEIVRRRIGRLIVASSMSVYGEGMYVDRHGHHFSEVQRKRRDLEHGVWNVHDADGLPLEPVATSETKSLDARSIYALNKFDQERMCLLTGQAYGIPTTALRFFNVYGPRQALTNPYTGVLANFGVRLLNHRKPLIFEDGLQRRDFIHVRDVVRACRMALQNETTAGTVLNIGSGTSTTIRGLAEGLAKAMDSSVEPEITGQFRTGDIRHCFADISKAKEVLGFKPQVALQDGLQELSGWLRTQAAEDRVARARQELTERGLTA